MKMIRNIMTALFSALLFFGLTHPAFAQADPPERVARLNLIEGNVSFLPSGGSDNDWITAALNRPLTTGDRLWTDANGRSELHVGSTAIRMDSNTGISFLNLGDTTVQIRLSDGSMIVRLRRLDRDNTFEVDTPNLAFTIKRPGDYRIDTHPDNNLTVVTVRLGEGEVIGGGRSWQIISDQQATFTGTDSLNYDLKDADAQPPGNFDKWARSRDEREDRVAAGRYVSPEMTGYEDLDAYGAWRRVPEYGWCWTPSAVAVGWAPYRHGHWVWIAPWGWTWVDDSPWGFAPFHYGRWAFWGSTWVWVPGPIVVRPVYAPALVAWVGGGSFRFSVSFGAGGGVGWFPLGPREVFVPYYRGSERYVTNINVTNTVLNRMTVINAFNNRNVQNITYMNRAAPNAVTMVSHETFVNARPVGRNVVNVPARELASAPISREVSAVPERASVYGAGNRNAPQPPARAMNRSVVATRTPPPEPNHFARPQSAPAYRPPNQPPNQGPPARSSPQVERSQQPAQPLVRPAPPVRRPTSQERTDMKVQQKSWENAHPRDNRSQKQNRPSPRN